MHKEMLQAAAVMLLLTAGGGLAMAVRRLVAEVNPPSWLAMAHGFMAASAVTLLGYSMVTGDPPRLAVSGAVFLLVAAADGILMNLHFHLGGWLIPRWLLHTHIFLSAIGTACIAWAAWS